MKKGARHRDPGRPDLFPPDRMGRPHGQAGPC
nr:MAG TPA: hypothetical protein [Caudoviricetes sp.]